MEFDVLVLILVVVVSFALGFIIAEARRGIWDTMNDYWKGQKAEKQEAVTQKRKATKQELDEIKQWAADGQGGWIEVDETITDDAPGSPSAELEDEKEAEKRRGQRGFFS